MKMSKPKKEFKKNPRYYPVGAMLSKKEPNENGDKEYWIKIDKDTVVTVNGVEVSAFNIQRPLDKLEFLLKNDHISKEKYEEMADRYSEGGDLEYVTFDITADISEK
jgi:hypothetical protein